MQRFTQHILIKILNIKNPRSAQIKYTKKVGSSKKVGRY
jgi:hypothetical protein